MASLCERARARRCVKSKARLSKPDPRMHSQQGKGRINDSQEMLLSKVSKAIFAQGRIKQADALTAVELAEGGWCPERSLTRRADDCSLDAREPLADAVDPSTAAPLNVLRLEEG